MGVRGLPTLEWLGRRSREGSGEAEAEDRPSVRSCRWENLQGMQGRRAQGLEGAVRMLQARVRMGACEHALHALGRARAHTCVHPDIYEWVCTCLRARVSACAQASAAHRQAQTEGSLHAIVSHQGASKPSALCCA